MGTLLLTFCKAPSTTYDVKREQLVACETGNGICKPIEVTRRKEDTKTIVRFLISSYNTEIQLFDSAYRNHIIEHIKKDSIKPILNNYIKKEIGQL